VVVNVNNNIFDEQVKLWSTDTSATEYLNWEEQMKMLSEMVELITPERSLEEVIAVTYTTINQLMDAYQFAVAIYDEEEGLIHYRGLVENNQRLPDIIVDACETNCLTAYSIRNDVELFMNDVEIEFRKYVKELQKPKHGLAPKAGMYVPLKLNNKVAGVIVVKTIHKNVYQRHHLYILRTLGNCVMRSLALAKETAKSYPRSEATQKEWRWNETKTLSAKEKKLLMQLTEREKEVLLLLAGGLSNKMIADKLFISPATVKSHTLNIYHKLQVGNRTSAIVEAIELNWFL